MKKTISILVLSISTSFVFAQNATTHSGKIIGSFDLGSKEVTTILDETTGCTRKSTPHTKGIFIPNETVQLIIKENKQLAEVVKPSLPEQVYANKKCQGSVEELTSDQISFLQELNIALNVIIDENISDAVPSIINPYTQFGVDNRIVVEQIYTNNPNKQFTIPLFYNEYKTMMLNLGYSSEIQPLTNSTGLINKHNDGSNNSFLNLRYEVYENYNSSNFAIQVSELIFSKLNLISSKENGLSLLYEAERMIYETPTINQSEKESFLKAMAIGVNNIDFIEYANGGSWKDCASFVLSGVGGFLGGPFTMALGITGMALSAEGCEKYLGW